jgi:CheY-like chemotaxis protein
MPPPSICASMSAAWRASWSSVIARIGLSRIASVPAIEGGTSFILQEMGHEVLDAGSGGHALAMLDETPNVDLMLFDFAMPGMNGAELARHVRAKRPALPMIFLTGYADTTALADTDEDHIIRKPLRDHELVAKICAVLKPRVKTTISEPGS